MAPADNPNPLLYTPCSQCLNEGWLFCTICHAYFCDDHACIHVAPQVNADAVRDVQEPEHETPLENESKAFFHELSATQLQDTGEIALRSYFRRLLSEAKRIQREIERRMVYSTELMGGPAYRRRRQLSQDEIDAARERTKRKLDLTPLGLLEREQRALRAKELQRKKQQEIQANIAILMEQARLGNISLEQIQKIGAKKS